MINRPDTNAQRLKRHKRVRGKISGTPERPRLNVFRSEANIYAQVIDDVNGVTLASASSLDKAIEGYGGNIAAATAVGKLVAERCKAKGLIVKGDIVHHKVYLTQDNITDTAITLSFDNFELLCFDCHNKEHNANASIRAGFGFDADGNIRPLC